MNEDLTIIEAYRDAFRKHAKEGVIDMDEQLPQPFNFQLHRLEEIYEYLIEEYQGTEARKNEMLAIKVLELIVLCDRYLADAQLLQKDCIYHTVIEQFTTLIQKHYTTQRTVAFYGKALNIHPNHLNSLVKKYTGLTAKELISLDPIS